MTPVQLAAVLTTCALLVACGAEPAPDPHAADTATESTHPTVPNAPQPSVTETTGPSDVITKATSLESITVGATNSIERQVTVDATSLDVTSQWADGQIVLSLTSPSGRVINRDTAAGDVTHEVGPTFESYHVKSPERGTWTATLHGARVAPGGQPTRLVIYQAPTHNADPVARIQQRFTGRTVKVDATGSTDADGRIVKYLWEFGDGALAHGPTAIHAYTEPGTYRVSLAVQDNRGDWDVTSASKTVVLR